MRGKCSFSFNKLDRKLFYHTTGTYKIGNIRICYVRNKKLSKGWFFQVSIQYNKIEDYKLYEKDVCNKSSILSFFHLHHERNQTSITYRDCITKTRITSIGLKTTIITNGSLTTKVKNNIKGIDIPFATFKFFQNSKSSTRNFT